jgi:hypothetical protein
MLGWGADLYSDFYCSLLFLWLLKLLVGWESDASCFLVSSRVDGWGCSRVVVVSPSRTALGSAESDSYPVACVLCTGAQDMDMDMDTTGGWWRGAACGDIWAQC